MSRLGEGESVQKRKCRFKSGRPEPWALFIMILDSLRV